MCGFRYRCIDKNTLLWVKEDPFAKIGRGNIMVKAAFEMCLAYETLREYSQFVPYHAGRLRAYKKILLIAII